MHPHFKPQLTVTPVCQQPPGRRRLQPSSRTQTRLPDFTPPSGWLPHKDEHEGRVFTWNTVVSTGLTAILLNYWTIGASLSLDSSWWRHAAVGSPRCCSLLSPAFAACHSLTRHPSTHPPSNYHSRRSAVTKGCCSTLFQSLHYSHIIRSFLPKK